MLFWVKPSVLWWKLHWAEWWSFVVQRIAVNNSWSHSQPLDDRGLVTANTTPLRVSPSARLLAVQCSTRMCNDKETRVFGLINAVRHVVGPARISSFALSPLWLHEFVYREKSCLRWCLHLAALSAFLQETSLRRFRKRGNRRLNRTQGRCLVTGLTLKTCCSNLFGLIIYPIPYLGLLVVASCRNSSDLLLCFGCFNSAPPSLKLRMFGESQ